VPDFILKSRNTAETQILVAADNFGCGLRANTRLGAIADFWASSCVIAAQFCRISFYRTVQERHLPIALRKTGRSADERRG